MKIDKAFSDTDIMAHRPVLRNPDFGLAGIDYETRRYPPGSPNKQYVNLIPQICPVSTGILLSCIPEAPQRPRCQDVQTGQRQARPAPMVGQPGGLGSGGLPSLCGTANRNKPEKSEDFFLKSKFTLSRTRLILCL